MNKGYLCIFLTHRVWGGGVAIWWGARGWFIRSCSSLLIRANPHLFACSHLSRSFVCSSFVCAHPHSFPLVFAGPRSSQPLICVCIKYIVSKYIIAKKLTFIPWIINLDKNYWLVLMRRITYIIFWSEMGVGARGESGLMKVYARLTEPYLVLSRVTLRIYRETMIK